MNYGIEVGILALAWVIVAYINRNKPQRPLMSVDASGGGAGLRINSPEK